MESEYVNNQKELSDKYWHEGNEVFLELSKKYKPNPLRKDRVLWYIAYLLVDCGIEKPGEKKAYQRIKKFIDRYSLPFHT